MFNEAGDVMYVGKARSLKKRVGNYAQGRLHSNRLTRMVRETTHMEFVTTRTETEALLLEANLINRLRPRFNVLLRDDKSFHYILVTGDNRAPAIFQHRGARASKRPEETTYALPSLIRISYVVFCLTKTPHHHRTSSFIYK